jgi:Leucine-rich repeat (LRR) protein
MFPSNPWVPYRLERLDLSKNLLPVLTFDLTFGTKKLKVLNVSQNSISEIRKFVLGNITSLETLDMSGNRLANLDDPDNPFDLPENMTNLLLQNNAIYRLNYDKLLALKKLKELNLENNQLIHLNKSLIDEIKSGMSVKFIGNPLVCNCEIRSLKHYLLEQTNPQQQYADIVCSQPKNLEGLSLREVEDQQLTCTELERSNVPEMNHDYEVLPDLRFRDIFL